VNFADKRRGVAARNRLLGGCALTLLSALAGGSAFAQDDSAQVGEVVVTASRVARSGFTAPTPTVVVGADTLERRGATNIAQVLQELPSLRAGTNPQTNGTSQRTPGSSYADLRGLGPLRTLVLVDGRRFVPQIVSGVASYQVDLNQIPAMMIERTEVVTGGASAQWGSDAVAGVVNLILKKNFTGLNIEGQVGQSQWGDNRSGRIAGLAGTSFMGGRGHITISADYERQNGVRDISNRKWGREGYYALITNPCPLAAAVSAACPTGGNGQAQNLILPNAQFSALTPGGVITAGPLRGIAIAPGGALYNFQYGQFVGPTYMAGGGQPGVLFLTEQKIVPPYRRANVYTRGSFDLTDNITAWTELSYAWSHGGGPSTASRGTYTITNENPFIPAALRTLMQQNNLTSISLGRTNFDIGITTGDVANYTGRISGGLQGTLPWEGNWKWDINGGFGSNRNAIKVRNNLIGNGPTTVYRNMFNAVDAVVAPAGNAAGIAAGTIVCRSTLTNPANGCVPINLFGFQTPSQAAKAYVQGTELMTTIYDQTTFSANLTGEPFKTWAGPVSVATGFEYRKEVETSHVDLIGQAGSYEGNNGSNTNGAFNVKEGYFEAVVPLASDMAFAKSLDLNGAIRYADYSTSAGGQTTWKVGATWTPIDGLLIRAARSRDIRAPNLFDLYNPGTNLNSTVNYPTTVPIRQLTNGNPNLTAEKADTTTIGFSYSPSFVPGLQVSVDYYRIKLNDAIGSLTAQQIGDLCRIQGSADACSLITFQNGVPIQILASPLNLASVLNTGFDIQASYRTPLDRFFSGAPGQLAFNFGGAYVQHVKVNTGAPGAATIDRAGEIGGVNNPFTLPRFRFSASATYEVGPAMVSLQLRHIAGGKFDNTFVEGVNINDNSIPGRQYVDLSGSYKIGDRWEIFGVINNALNTDPPPAPSAFTSMTNPVYFDTIGRTWKLGFRYKH
jgi:outer membrane receptor protein involved in Fe transport